MQPASRRSKYDLYSAYPAERTNPPSGITVSPDTPSVPIGTMACTRPSAPTATSIPQIFVCVLSWAKLPSYSTARAVPVRDSL